MGHVIFCKRRTALAYKDQQAMMADLVCNFLHAPNKLRPEYQDVGLSQVKAVRNFVGGLAEV